MTKPIRNVAIFAAALSMPAGALIAADTIPKPPSAQPIIQMPEPAPNLQLSQCRRVIDKSSKSQSFAQQFQSQIKKCREEHAELNNPMLQIPITTPGREVAKNPPPIDIYRSPMQMPPPGNLSTPS